MVVDDHPLFRQGLCRILETQEDIKVIQEVADGEKALQMAKQLMPNVILMDINLPRMNGLDVTRELKHAVPEIAVIILTAYYNSEHFSQSGQAGAVAYFPKDIPPRQLIDAIRQASK